MNTQLYQQYELTDLTEEMQIKVMQKLSKEKLTHIHEMEQTTLMACLEKKSSEELHFNLNSIVERLSETRDFGDTLYRGIAPKEVKLMEDAVASRLPFQFGRVTSFTEKENIAEQFCSNYEYGTKVKIRMYTDSAFCYYTLIQDILYARPITEFIPNWRKNSGGYCSVSEMMTRRQEYLDMVQDEYEWMVSATDHFVVTDASFEDDFYVIDVLRTKA